MRMNKEGKMVRNANRLAELFGVPAPSVSIGSAGRMTNGLYRRYQFKQRWYQGRPVGMDATVAPHITLDHSLTWNTILETLAHEFAHHLAYEWGLSCVQSSSHKPLFWQILSEVRNVILPGSHDTTLEYNLVDQVDKSWR